MMNRACIITTPCSGKSTFRKSCENKYKMLHVIEQELEEVPAYSCVLTANHIPNQEEYIYAIVLISRLILTPITKIGRVIKEK